jgi:hypothetical protein
VDLRPGPGCWWPGSSLPSASGCSPGPDRARFLTSSRCPAPSARPADPGPFAPRPEAFDPGSLCVLTIEAPRACVPPGWGRIRTPVRHVYSRRTRGNSGEDA